MRQGGRYLREKPGAKAERVEWTRTAEEARAERKARASAARAEGADKPAPAPKGKGDDR